MELVVVGVAVAVGLVLRFATTSPLWLDEALSVNIASLPLGELAGALRHDGHPPLYYTLLHGWMELFGDGDVAVRSLSGVFSVLTLPAVALLGRRRRGREAALAAVVLLALSPYATLYATEARMYSLVILLVAVGWLLLDRLMDGGGWSPAVGIGVVATLLLYSHYWSIWLLGVIGLVLLRVAWRGADPQRRTAARRGAAALVAAAIAFVPWLPVMLDQLAHTGTPWGSPQRPTTSFAVTLGDLAGVHLAPEAIAGVVLLVGLLVLAVTGIPQPPSRIVLDLRTVPGIRRELLVVAGALLLGILITLATGATFATRYAAFAVPVVFVAAGIGLIATPSRTTRGVIGALAVLALGGAAVVGVGDQRTQARSSATAVMESVAPGDIVLLCPDQLGPAFAREFDPDVPVEVLTYPALTDPRFVDWRDYGERNAAADPEAIALDLHERAGGAGVWLVWMPGYSTFDSQCERVRDALSTVRRLELAEEPGLGTYSEPMWTMRFSIGS